MASPTKKTKNAKMTLYQCPFYRSFKCLWLIYELGVEDDVELVRLDTINDKDSEEFKEYQRSVHPHGTIPALVVEGEGVILESAAICLYLADRYGKLAPPIAERKDYYDWLIYGAVTVDEVLEFLYWQWVSPRGKPDPEGVKRMEAKYDICMKRLTDTIKGRKYICGDRLTAADCVLGYNVWGSSLDMYNKGSLVKEFPEVKEYIKRLTERPAFQAAVKAQGEETTVTIDTGVTV